MIYSIVIGIVVLHIAKVEIMLFHIVLCYL